MTTRRTPAAKGAALNATEHLALIQFPSVAQAINYNLTAAHNGEFHELANGVVATLPTASGSLTETGDWEVTLKCVGADATVGRNSQTIDGAASDLSLVSGDSVTLVMDAAKTNYKVKNRSTLLGVTATAAEINTLAGILATTAEINRLVGSTTGTFTGTLTGCTTSPTMTVAYVIIGKLAMVTIPVTTATSNASTLSITGLPAALQPSGSGISGLAAAYITDNNVPFIGNAQVSGSTLNFYRAGGSSFTPSGVKGVQNTTFTYSLTGV